MSLPYNEFMLDEMQKLLVSRTHLPVFEATHMAHVMLQTCRNVLGGGGQKVNFRKGGRNICSPISCPASIPTTASASSPAVPR